MGKESKLWKQFSVAGTNTKQAYIKTEFQFQAQSFDIPFLLRVKLCPFMRGNLELHFNNIDNLGSNEQIHPNCCKLIRKSYWLLTFTNSSPVVKRTGFVRLFKFFFSNPFSKSLQRKVLVNVMLVLSSWSRLFLFFQYANLP